MTKAPFVLIHGSWHDSHSWDLLRPLLTQKGFSAHAPDLPGAGKHAKSPQSFHERPLDLKTFATEASPSASITQEERTGAVVDLLRALDQPAILVGASMGGATISDVAESVPELVAAVVYSAGFLMAPGQPPMAAIQHESMAGGKLGSLLLADPGVTQSMRLDPRSEDPGYRDTFRKAFYHDADDAVIDSIGPYTHSDEPTSVIGRPSKSTPERFGFIPRYYIRCTEDRLMPLAAQDRFIALADAAFGTKTKVYDVASGHCPYVSAPETLAEILTDIAKRTA